MILLINLHPDYKVLRSQILKRKALMRKQCAGYKNLGPRMKIQDDQQASEHRDVDHGLPQGIAEVLDRFELSENPDNWSEEREYELMNGMETSSQRRMYFGKIKYED